MSMQKPNAEHFYLNSVRNQVLVFMSLFTNMKVVDEEVDRGDFNTVPTTKESFIDVIYATRERLALERDYDANRPTSEHDTKVPRFSININTMTYDPTRALNFYRKRRLKQNSSQYRDRMPIPYNINMNLDILCKYELHIHQIIENIVPYFSPYILVRIKENVTNLDLIPRELKIDFSGDALREIPIEYADEERRIVKGQLNFTIRGYIYKPLNAQPGPILNIPIRFWNDPVDRDLMDNLIDSIEVSGPNWMPPQIDTI